MAKALFGHVVSGPDVQMVGEFRRMRARIAELESEISRLRAENDHLLAEMATDTTMTEFAGIDSVESIDRDSLTRV